MVRFTNNVVVILASGVRQRKLLRRCAKITSARWMVTMRPNGVLRLLFYQNLLKLFCAGP